jgi:hypothetical protein
MLFSCEQEQVFTSFFYKRPLAKVFSQRLCALCGCIPHTYARGQKKEMEKRMKIFIRNLSFILMSILFTSCGAEPTPVLPQVLPPAATQAPQVSQGNNPYVPQPGDEALVRGDVIIDSSTLTRMETMPPAILLNFSYFPPSPCHQLRAEVTPPNAENRIDVTVYGLAENKPCDLAAIATSLPASLDLGGFPTGHYSVWLNGAMVGEFDM